jgi:hypothetical protein
MNSALLENDWKQQQAPRQVDWIKNFLQEQ